MLLLIFYVGLNSIILREILIHRKNFKNNNFCHKKSNKTIEYPRELCYKKVSSFRIPQSGV